MADSSKNVHIVVSATLRDKLKARQHPGQSLAGVIQELLNIVEQLEVAHQIPK